MTLQWVVLYNNDNLKTFDRYFDVEVCSYGKSIKFKKTSNKIGEI